MGNQTHRHHAIYVDILTMLKLDQHNA